MSIRLHLNESPFPPSPKAIEKLISYAYYLNRYSINELEQKLYDRLSEYADVPREYLSIFPSSSSIIVCAIKYAKTKNLRFITTRPGFHAVIEFARSEGFNGIEFFPLKPRTFDLDLDSFLEFIDKNSVVLIANPNNPTSNILLQNENDIIEIAKRVHLLIIDEAYFEFSGISFAKLALQHDNIVIIRTFSKAFCLAGARIGYAIASRKVLDALNSFRIAYDVPIPSMALALGALEDLDYMKRVIDTIKHLRNKLIKEIRSLGLYVIDSSTNFLLIEMPLEGVEVAKKLRLRGILVRAFPEFEELRYFIRVSVGSEDENRKFINALKEILSSDEVTASEK